MIALENVICKFLRHPKAKEMVLQPDRLKPNRGTTKDWQPKGGQV
jgi:hypothetical protein